MPTGLRNSPSQDDLSGIPTKRAPILPRGAINKSYPVILRATGIAQPCVPFDIPLGASVNVRGANGTPAGNSATVFVGLNPEDLANGGGRQVTPDTEIFFPVDSTSQIWVRGTAGDGVQVYVTANPIG